MSIKLNGQTIAGIATKTKYNAHNLLDFKWSDHEIDDMSWLRADTFSWQDGTVYTEAYNKLVTSISGATTKTEQGVTFYECTNGLRIALANQENNVLSAYNTDGVAWYYILDTDNTRFKLPRTKYGFVGLRDEVGKFVPQDVKLPNITGNVGDVQFMESIYSGGAIYTTTDTGSNSAYSGNTVKPQQLHFDASRSSSVYSGNGTNTNIQQKSTQMYLYFYVGEFSQTAIEQTAGLNAELFNNKVDINASNLSTTGKSLISGLGMPSSRYIDLTLGASGTTYTAPANGYFVIAGNFGVDNGWLNMKNSSNDLLCTKSDSAKGNYSCRAFIPAKKNDNIIISYSHSPFSSTVSGTPYFKFIYAEGDE